MPDTDDKTAPTDPAKKNREREQVDKRLAQSPTVAVGNVVLADGRRLDYLSRCEYLPVLLGGLGAERSDPQAAVFTTAYTLTGAEGGARPVCFAFNGGPGSSSVWLHLGALGPKRVVVPDDGTMPAPPYAVSDNPLTWLAHFDLVFIDPPHTGWSVAVSDDARKKLFSVDGDVAALAEVMRGWLTRHKRWGSKVYLAGESYGTTRGAALADALQQANVALAGLVLVSCAMDLQSIVFAPRNDLPYALFLPALAGVAQFHGKLKGAAAASPQAARSAAEAFVADDYLRALNAGARLSTSQRRHVAKRLSELSGLPQALVEEKNLRISDQTFFFELLRDAGRMVGRLDARATGPMAASRTRDWEFDPGIEAIAAPYGMELEPPRWLRARSQGQRLCVDQRRPGPRAATQPTPARAGGQRTLRPRHTIQRERLVAGTNRCTGRGAGTRRAPLLRCRPHDVHARGRPDQARARPRGVADRRVSA
jgi:carboxypeptidase C (cathepsin A)